jgi:cytochrome c-type biogenesis protein CcmH
MILFWVLCSAMLLAAILFVALPLLRKSTPNNVLRDAANLGILRDQSTELEVDLDNGLLTQEAYDQGKRELQARLLEEVKITEQPPTLPRNPAKMLAITLAVLLPLFTIPVYMAIGNSKAFLPQEEQSASAVGDGIIRTEEGLQALVSELQDNPENPNGWYNLARSYIEMKRYEEGSKAYEELVKLVPDEAQLWANYADVYAMAHGQTLNSEEVAKILEQALALDPNNITALALSGSVGMERGDFVLALTHWQKLYGLLPPGSKDAQRFKGSIKNARKQLAAQPGGKKKLAQLPFDEAPQVADSSATAITGKVALSPALAGKASPNDTVFILARAAQGPPMPLAVFRKQVKDLPMEFTLDDSMAMRPEMKLSGFDQVVVVARVSKSGQGGRAQPGDLEGLTAAIKPGTKGLNIVIDSVIP